MKVVLVNKFLYPNGGSETYLFQLGEQLKKMGHQVQYFGMKDEKNIVGNEYNLYTNPINFHSNHLSRLGYPFKIIYSKEARKKMNLLLEKFQPDVVHLNNFNFQLTPSIIYSAKSKNIPVVFTAHDYQLLCPNHMFYNEKNGRVCERCQTKGYRECIKHACIHGSRIKSALGFLEAKLYEKLHTYQKIDQIICPSQFLEDRFRKQEIYRENTVTMHNFVQPVEAKNEVSEPYVLYFGRYSNEKGIKTLLEVCKKLPNIPFVFAGKGPLEEQMVGQSNVRNIGFKDKEELEQLVRRARFTVYPSEWYENCPFSVMESQMYGTPVIGAKIGGIPELIQEGKTGLLFESGNQQALVKAIEMLWSNDNLCNELHENCKKIQFDSVEQYSEKMIEIYKKVCKNRTFVSV